MSVLFFKRFLSRPFQVASVVPSSRTLTRRVVGKLDLSAPRVIVEFGPGEGCHTRELARAMHAHSRLFLFELDPVLASDLSRQFRDDPRITVLNTDAQNIQAELNTRGIASCDYVLSGIPFSILEVGKKRRLLENIHASLAPDRHSAFVIYQVTNELRQHARIFPRVESEYCLQNIPPMYVVKFYKQGLNGHHAARKTPIVAAR